MPAPINGAGLLRIVQVMLHSRALHLSKVVLCRLVATMALVLALASTAAAHASLTGTNPVDGAVVATAPSQFTLSFSEPVSPLTLRLVRPDGSSVELERFALQDRSLEINAPTGLRPGTHVLSWRVVSEDGHPIGGSIVFSIGAPSVAPQGSESSVDWPVRISLWLAKIGLYLGLFFGIGGVFARHWFMSGARPGARFVNVMLALGVVATVASPGLQGLDALGLSIARLSDGKVWQTGMSTSFGRTVLAMIIALLLAGVAVRRQGAASRWMAVFSLVLGAAALALSGHASAAQPQWLTRPAVFLHAAAIALWVGALIPLARAFQASDAIVPVALRRFSGTIPYIVIVLIIAGGALAVVQVQHPAALISTAYGKVLLIKLELLVFLFGLAALNRWVLTPAAKADEAGAARIMARSIVAETLVVVMIFGVAAGWRFTPPPRAIAAAAAQPVSTHLHSDKVMATVTVSPGHAGPVEISAFVMAGDFSPLDPKEVTFVLSNPAAGVEPMKRKAQRGEDGIWRARDVTIPLPGTWALRVDILISDFEMARIAGEINLRSGE